MALQITQQPVGGAYSVGETYSLSAKADGGDSTYTCQWKKNDNICLTESNTSGEFVYSDTFSETDIGFYSATISGHVPYSLESLFPWTDIGSNVTISRNGSVVTFPASAIGWAGQKSSYIIPDNFDVSFDVWCRDGSYDTNNIMFDIWTSAPTAVASVLCSYSIGEDTVVWAGNGPLVSGGDITNHFGAGVKVSFTKVGNTITSTLRNASGGIIATSTGQTSGVGPFSLVVYKGGVQYTQELVMTFSSPPAVSTPVVASNTVPVRQTLSCTPIQSNSQILVGTHISMSTTVVGGDIDIADGDVFYNDRAVISRGTVSLTPNDSGCRVSSISPIGEYAFTITSASSAVIIEIGSSTDWVSIRPHLFNQRVYFGASDASPSVPASLSINTWYKCVFVKNVDSTYTISVVVLSSGQTLASYTTPVRTTIYDRVTIIKGGAGTLTVTNPYLYTKMRTQYSYIWKKGSTAVATTQQYTKAISVIEDDAYYTVSVTSGTQNVLSPTKHLTVVPHLTIGYISGTSDRIVGESLYLEVDVLGGVPPYTYEWRKDGLSIGTGVVFTKTNVQTTDTGVYTCHIIDDYETIDSKPFVVTVFMRVLIGGDTIIYVGDPLSLLATAIDGTEPYTYSWYKDGVSLGSGALYEKDITTVNDCGVYEVHVTDATNRIKYNSVFVTIKLKTNVNRYGTDREINLVDFIPNTFRYSKSTEVENLVSVFENVLNTWFDDTPSIPKEIVQLEISPSDDYNRNLEGTPNYYMLE